MTQEQEPQQEAPAVTSEAPAEQPEAGNDEPEQDTQAGVVEDSEIDSKVTVKVNASMRGKNLLHLKAVVSDPEGNDYEYQWQVSVDGGESYEDIEDQTEDFLDVELDEENLTNLWRVRIHAN